MTEKQLYDVINKAEPRGQSVTYEGIPCTARTCATRLNRLTWENEQLKSYTGEMEDYLARLEEKNEKLKKDCSNLIDDNTEYVAEINQMHKENEQLKQIINELSDMLQFDVENEIRSYPVILSEYLSNALKELQKND